MKTIFTIASISTPDGVLEKKDGYYKVNLCSLNAYNNSGKMYLDKGVAAILADSESAVDNSFAKKLKAGFLQGEMGHPAYTSGTTTMDFYIRNLQVHPDRVSHTIREVTLLDTGKPSLGQHKGNIILIQGWVKPMGPYGELLKKVLDDPDVNVAFSIRCILTEDSVKLKNKVIQKIVTFDWVETPGLEAATKFKTLSREDSSHSMTELLSMEVTKDELNIDSKRLECLSVENGNDTAADIDELKKIVDKNNRPGVLHKW